MLEKAHRGITLTHSHNSVPVAIYSFTWFFPVIPLSNKMSISICVNCMNNTHAKSVARIIPEQQTSASKMISQQNTKLKTLSHSNSVLHSHRRITYNVLHNVYGMHGKMSWLRPTHLHTHDSTGEQIHYIKSKMIYTQWRTSANKL